MSQEIKYVREEMSEMPTSELGVESLAFVYGVAYLDGKRESIDKIDRYIEGAGSIGGTALRVTMGLILAEAFSDEWEIWNRQGQVPVDIPIELQNKTTDWMIEGLTSDELTAGQKELIRPVVINLLGRMSEGGSSILDEEHKERIMTEGGITDEEFINSQQKLISDVAEITVTEAVRQAFGRFE
jgi:hypothetical protein